MYTCLRVLFVVLVYVTVNLAENSTSEDEIISTTEVRSRKLSVTTSTPSSETTFLNSTRSQTSSPAFENAIISASTHLVPNEKQENVTLTNHDLSTSSTSVKTKAASTSSENLCPGGDCTTISMTTSDTSSMSSTQASSVESTSERHSESGLASRTTDSPSSPPATKLSSQTHEIPTSSVVTQTFTNPTNQFVSTSAATDSGTTFTGQKLDPTSASPKHDLTTQSTGQKLASTSAGPKHDLTTASTSTSSEINSGIVTSDPRGDEVDYPGHSLHSPSISSTHLSVFGVLMGIVVAVVFLFIIIVILRRVKDAGKKKMCLNKEANRIDMLTLRRFTINDVKASLGGIPANNDIWMEMNKDSSIVV